MSINKCAAVFILLLLIANLTSSSPYYPLIKAKFVSSSQVVSQPLTDPGIYLVNQDGAIYTMLTLSLIRNLNLKSQTEVNEDLARANIPIDSIGARNAIYIAHVDRFRLLYPLCTLLLFLIFGFYSFIIVNIACLLILFFLFLSYTRNQPLTRMLFGSLLGTLPIYQYTWRSTPELLIALLLVLLGMKLGQVIRWRPEKLARLSTLKPIKLGKRDFGVILTYLVLINLAKPMFIVTFLILLPVTLILRNYSFSNGVVNGIFGGVWLFCSNSKFSAAELLNQSESIKNILQVFPSSTFLKVTPGQISETTISNSVKTFSSEIQQVFPNNNQFILLSVILMSLIMISLRELRFLTLLFFGYMGALVTQSYSGSMGTNFRFTMPIVLIMIFYLSANIELNIKKNRQNV